MRVYLCLLLSGLTCNWLYAFIYAYNLALLYTFFELSKFNLKSSNIFDVKEKYLEVLTLCEIAFCNSCIRKSCFHPQSIFIFSDQSNVIASSCHGLEYNFELVSAFPSNRTHGILCEKGNKLIDTFNYYIKNKYWRLFFKHIHDNSLLKFLRSSNNILFERNY